MSSILGELTERTVVEQAVSQLRNAIISGRLEPGVHITEAFVMRELSIARTTVREALSRLAATGLVEVEPHRGHRVRHFSDQDISSIGEVLTLLEGRAASSIALPFSREVEGQFLQIIESMETLRLPEELDRFVELDRAFHAELMNLHANPQLFNTWKSQEPMLGAMLVRLHRKTRLDGHVQAQRHARLLQAGMTGDPKALIAEIERHYYQRPLEIGAIAKPKRILIVPELPKAWSGK